jgi:hypothetical protein
MLKKLTVFIVLLSFILLAVPVSAAHYTPQPAGYNVSESVQPVIYERTIKVNDNGGAFRVGFADIIFKKGCLESDQLPIAIDVEISAVNGVAGIEFHPDIPSFNKEVTIRVDAYKGYIYDKTQKKNIYVEIKKQQLKVSHFSRYAFS